MPSIWRLIIDRYILSSFHRYIYRLRLAMRHDVTFLSMMSRFIERAGAWYHITMFITPLLVPGGYHVSPSALFHARVHAWAFSLYADTLRHAIALDYEIITTVCYGYLRLLAILLFRYWLFAAIIDICRRHVTLGADFSIIMMIYARWCYQMLRKIVTSILFAPRAYVRVYLDAMLLMLLFFHAPPSSDVAATTDEMLFTPYILMMPKIITPLVFSLCWLHFRAEMPCKSATCCYAWCLIDIYALLDWAAPAATLRQPSSRGRRHADCSSLHACSYAFHFAVSSLHCCFTLIIFSRQTLRKAIRWYRCSAHYEGHFTCHHCYFITPPRVELVDTMITLPRLRHVIEGIRWPHDRGWDERRARERT